jgi:hypothetical protein
MGGRAQARRPRRASLSEGGLACTGLADACGRDEARPGALTDGRSGRVKLIIARLRREEPFYRVLPSLTVA